MKEKIFKFMDFFLEIFKKFIDCIEEIFIYLINKFNKILNIRDIFFFLLGTTLATFICWRLFIFYTHNVILTGTMLVENNIYKVQLSEKPITSIIKEE